MGKVDSILLHILFLLHIGLVVVMPLPVHDTVHPVCEYISIKQINQSLSDDWIDMT